MIEYFNELGLIGLFLASFLASTIVPISSEVVLLFLLYNGTSPLMCLVIGTLGNTLGGATTYYIGFVGKTKFIEKYLGISSTQLNKWYLFTQKKGKYLAFLSWVPFVGDIFMLLLGLFKSPQLITLFFMFVGKLVRYAILIYSTNLILN